MSLNWRRKWQPTPVFLPGESQGQRTWRAAIYGVAQSRTRLKRLNSSNVSKMEGKKKEMFLNSKIRKNLKSQEKW